MLKLILGNVNSKIVGKYPFDLVNELTSFYIPGAHFSPKYKDGLWDGRRKFLNRYTGVFPTGLAGDLLKGLREAGEKVIVEDYREKPRLGKVIKIDQEFEDRDYQVEAIEKALYSSRGVFNIATNGGKTYIASKIISQTNVNTLFLVHRRELFEQTVAELEGILGITVGQLGNGKNIPGKITVAMIPTITRNIKKHKKLLNRTQMIFADECHHMGSQSWYKVFENCNAYYRFGLSGTPVGRSDNGEMFLRAATGKILMTVTNKQLIEQDVSAKPLIFMQRCQVKPTTRKSTWQEMYNAQIVNNRDRNTKVCDWFEKYLSRGKQVLLLVERTKHGNNIKNMMAKRGISVPFTHGGSSVEHRHDCLEGFKEGRIQGLVASSILDEGISVDGIEVVIFAGSKKSAISYMQRIGRGLRRKKGQNKVVVVDFYDEGQKFLQEWSEERYNLYTSEDNGFKVHFRKKY